MTPSPHDLRLQALRATAVAAAGGMDLRGFLEVAVEQMAAMLHAEHCSVLLVNDERLHCFGSLGLPADYLSGIEGLRIGADQGTCGRAATIGETVVTADVQTDPHWTDFRGLAADAGLRSCWSVPLIGSDGNVLGTFATYDSIPREPDPGEVALAETLAAVVALGVEGLRRHDQLTSTQRATILALSTALDARDRYTGSHSSATCELALAVGDRLALTGEQLDQLEQVALLHDIGKLAIPNEVLHKMGPLDEDEWQLMRTHPEVGARILSRIPHLSEVARAVRHEHERWDGTGYPDGYAGVGIPMASRIVFACDAYHAMTSDRPYRAAMERGEAVSELCRCAGSQFDPDVIEALLEVIDEAPAVAPLTPLEAEERDRADALEAIARAMGGEDLFVFRRVSTHTFTHIGGAGRGAGWAGNIDVDAADEPRLAAAWRLGAPSLLAFDEISRVVGPYYARSAILVPVSPDTLVVFGSKEDRLAQAPPAEAADLAERAAETLEAVPTAKRLADELEVLEAVRAITLVAADDVEATLQKISRCVGGALSCEFAAVVVRGEDGEPDRVGWADRGWSPISSDLGERLVALTADAERPLLIQDAAEARRALALLGDVSGAASVHILPIGRPAVAVLVAVHAEPVLRGFTTLCRRIARAQGEAAEIVVRRALVQERLRQENRLLAQRVRTDPLTGVANRMAWNELMLTEEKHLSRGGARVSVAVADVDGLKRVNDSIGHQAGDKLLQAAAAVLSSCCRETDTVARVGGDEFAVLLRYCDEESLKAWSARVAEAVDDYNRHNHGPPVRMSWGTAAVADGGTVTAAFAAADKRMYDAKRAGPAA